MGNRVHVVRKMRQYGDTEAFNWHAEEFANFLNACDVEVLTLHEYDYSDFEVFGSEYKKALDLVRELKNAKGDKDKMDKVFDKYNVEGEDVTERLETLGYTIEDMYKTMLAFYRERDKKSDWIQFSSF